MKLQIEITRSKFDNMQTEEYIPLSILNKLLNSENIQKKSDEWNEEAQLQGIKKKIKNNRLIVKYETSKLGVGRVSPVKAYGYCLMRRQLRHTLAKDYYIDIDVVNCHPTLLYQLCESNNIECNMLKYYVSNREDFIQQVITENDNVRLTKDDIKNEVIKILYGNTKITLKSNLLKELTRDVLYITNLLIEANKDLYNLIEKYKKSKNKHLNNLDGSLVSVVLQYHENRCLEVMHTFLTNKKVIEKNNCVLCFDGIMVPRNKQYNGMIDETEKEIYDKTQFNIKLKIKSMDEGYDNLPETADDYETIKQKFEETHFKLINPMGYCRIDEDKNMTHYERKKFVDLYENKLIMDYEKNKKVSFTDKWMKDENILTIDKVDFKPCLETPSNVYNLFNGFAINRKNEDKDEENEKSLTLSFDDDENDEQPNVSIDYEAEFKKSLIYKHIYNICGKDYKTVDYVLMWLSRKVKNPTQLTNTSLIFKSEEGAGKDTFFDWFGRKILGDEYYINTSQVDKLLGHFNKLLTRKILIVVNESSSEKNKELTEDIKNNITNPVNYIEPKGKDAIMETNCCGYIWLTNNDYSMKISPTDRRFIAIKCNDDICNKEEYFNPLREEFNSGEYDWIFYKYLLQIDSDNYNFVKNRPMTELYNDMREINKPIMTLFLEYLISIYHIGNKETPIENIGANSLYERYKEYMKDHNFKFELNSTAFGLKIKAYPEISKKKTMKGAVYTIDYPNLEKSFIEKGFIKYD